MFIFYFLGVGPLCRSILCQFWLCEEAQCVYLCRHLGSLDHVIFDFCFVYVMYYILIYKDCTTLASLGRIPLDHGV